MPDFPIGDLPIVTVGLESPAKSPEEAPLPSALMTRPLIGLFDYVMLTVTFAPCPAFAILRNTATRGDVGYYLNGWRMFRVKTHSAPETLLAPGFSNSWGQAPISLLPSVSKSPDPGYPRNSIFDPITSLGDFGNETLQDNLDGSHPSLWGGILELSGEFTVSERSGQLSNCQRYLMAQDFHSIWTGTPPIAASGKLRVWTFFPPNPNPFDPNSYLNVSTINPNPWTGDVGGPFTPGAIAVGGFAQWRTENNTNAGRAVYGYFQQAALWAMSRQQIRGRIPTLYCIVEVCGFGDGEFYPTRYRVKVHVESAVLLPGQIIELPQPSRLDFPFNSGGIPVRGISVMFVPELTAGEYAALLGAEIVSSF